MRQPPDAPWGGWRMPTRWSSGRLTSRHVMEFGFVRESGWAGLTGDAGIWVEVVGEKRRYRLIRPGGKGPWRSAYGVARRDMDRWFERVDAMLDFIDGVRAAD